MTTEEGLPTIRHVRNRIEILRERLYYLCDKQAERIDDRLRPSHYIEAEIDAIEWALPILEVEWDYLVRLRTMVMRTEGRSEAQIADHNRAWSAAREASK